MSKKIIPYGRQEIDQIDIDAVINTLKSDYLTQGPVIKDFEEAFADYVGAKYAVAVSNATAGLHLSILALNLQKGERVITTPITFAASANCIRYAEGEVWFADINPETFLLDIDAVKKLIESKPKGFFKGIVPVDFGGLPIDFEAYRKLADEHNLWLIEDAAHAPGGYFTDSKGDKNKCGNGKYADLAVFSFHPVKHIACGEGGMITTNSKVLFDKLMKLRTHGITKDNMVENHGGWYYEMQELGYNYRLTDIQAALGITQLAKNNNGLKRRHEIAEKYKKELTIDFKFQQNGDAYNAYHLFVILVEGRLDFYNYLKEKGIFAQIHYIPVHTLPYYQSIGYSNAELSNSENYYAHCISLPMYPSLTEEDQNYVIETINNYKNT